ncbi:hypothetical protein TCAL_16031 [Tigriopus californicus]|uniref:Apple domain-containing protein n=1 Tax=Tigriopus californicus TaxID=6832 RepID=A0A553PQT8_TIGCA|nr:hypothetical protein TCAL_16031 [Tigriopus californicus]
MFLTQFVILICCCLIQIIVAQNHQCFYTNVLLPAPTLNLFDPDLTRTARDCQWLCQQTKACLFWNWVSPQYAGSVYPIYTCWLLSDKSMPIVFNGLMGGDRDCEDVPLV